MSRYLQFGQVPRKRHIQLRRPAGESLQERGSITSTFSRRRALIVLIRSCTTCVLRRDVRRTELAGRIELQAASELPLATPSSAHGPIARAGDIVTGRIPLMFNEDLVCYRCRPAETQSVLFRNGAADEIIFVQAGQGTVETTFGTLSVSPWRLYRHAAHDHLPIPAGRRSAGRFFDFGMSESRAATGPLLQSRRPADVGSSVL